MRDGLKDALGILRDAPLRGDLLAELTGLFVGGIAPLLELESLAFSRSARRSRKQRERLESTGERAFAIAHEARALFEETGGSLSPGTGLHGTIREVEWLGGKKGSHLGPEGPFYSDRERFKPAFVSMLRLDGVVRCLRVLGRAPGRRARIRHLRELRFDGRGSAEGQPGDHLFEVEVAGALQACGHHTIELGETDVLMVQEDGPDWGIECKRPAKTETIIRNVKDASTQLRSKGRPGFVAVSLEKVLGVRWLEDEGGIPAYRHGRSELSKALETVGAGIASALPRPESDSGTEVAEGSVLGVIFFAPSVLLQEDERMGGILVRPLPLTRAFTNPAFAPFAPLVEFFSNSLLVGTNELWRL